MRNYVTSEELLIATFGVLRKELLADVQRTLDERERAEPVPDDIDRQDDLSRPDYLGPDRSGTGVYYTAAELETLRSEARQSAVAEAATARAHFMLALQDAASALVDLGTLVIQGPTETNAAKRGSVAIGFRRAAHRIQHGSMKGFADAIDQGGKEF